MAREKIVNNDAFESMKETCTKLIQQLGLYLGSQQEIEKRKQDVEILNGNIQAETQKRVEDMQFLNKNIEDLKRKTDN